MPDGGRHAILYDVTAHQQREDCESLSVSPTQPHHCPPVSTLVSKVQCLVCLDSCVFRVRVLLRGSHDWLDV